MPTKQTGIALYKVQELESPIHKEFRGLRILIAIPNMAGRKPFTDIPIPSFDKPYFVCRFGDYEDWAALTKKWPSIWKAIQQMGFTSVHQYKPEDFKDEEVHEAGHIPGIDDELE